MAKSPVEKKVDSLLFVLANKNWSTWFVVTAVVVLVLSGYVLGVSGNVLG